VSFHFFLKEQLYIQLNCDTDFFMQHMSLLDERYYIRHLYFICCSIFKEIEQLALQ
jgi:hypothetical protein